MQRVLALYGKGRGPLVSLPNGPVTLEVRGSNGSGVKLHVGDEVKTIKGDGDHMFDNPGFFCVESEDEIHCTARID